MVVVKNLIPNPTFQERTEALIKAIKEREDLSKEEKKVKLNNILATYTRVINSEEFTDAKKLEMINDIKEKISQE